MLVYTCWNVYVYACILSYVLRFSRAGDPHGAIGGVEPDIPEKLNKIPIPYKGLNFIWIGKLDQITIDYLTIWRKINPDNDITLWTDEKASIVNHLKKTILTKIEHELTNNDNFKPNLKELGTRVRIKFQKAIWDIVEQEIDRSIPPEPFVINNLVREALGGLGITVFSQDQESIEALNEQVRKEIEECNLSFENIPDELNIKVKQIDPLFDTDKELRKYYTQEIVLRQNAAAASDLARLVILKEKGGIYIDTDVLPGLNMERIKQLVDDNPFLKEEIKRQGQYVFEAIIQVLLDRWHLEEEGIFEGREQQKRDGKYTDFIAKLDEEFDGNCGTQLRSEIEMQIKETSDIYAWFNRVDDTTIEVPAKAGVASLAGGNGVIAAVPDSTGIELTLEDIKLRYKFIKDSGYLNVDDFQQGNLDLHYFAYQYLRSLPKEDQLERARDVAAYRKYFKSYLWDGFKAQSFATYATSGPTPLIHSVARTEDYSVNMKASLMKQSLPREYNLEQYRGFFTATTEEQHISSWAKFVSDNGVPANGVDHNLQFVLRMGSSASEIAATNGLLAKATSRGQSAVKLGIFDSETAKFIDFSGDHWNMLSMNAPVNIAIVGHGDKYVIIIKKR